MSKVSRTEKNNIYSILTQFHNHSEFSLLVVYNQFLRTHTFILAGEKIRSVLEEEQLFQQSCFFNYQQKCLNTAIIQYQEFKNDK